MHLIPDALPVFVRFPSWRSDPDIDQKWSVGTISQPDLQLQFGGSEVSQKRGFSSPREKWDASEESSRTEATHERRNGWSVGVSCGTGL